VPRTMLDNDIRCSSRDATDDAKQGESVAPLALGLRRINRCTDRCFGRVDRRPTDGLAYRRHMCFAYVDARIPHFRGASWCRSARAVPRKPVVLPTCGTVIGTPRERRPDWSRHECWPASFRHRSGIRCRKIRDSASHCPIAGAKLCEPGDNTDQSGLVTRGGGITPLAGSAGYGHGHR
jgi:hypothetical protein